jgi:hypothetical protein
MSRDITGPTLQLDLPDSFYELPKLSSPLLIHDSWGARAFYFIPADLDDGMSDYEYIGDLSDADGRSVDFYLRPEPPMQWWLRWELRSGFVYTFLKEEDGESYASTVAQAISIADDELPGSPFLLPIQPLRLAVAPRIGYGEHAGFGSSLGLGVSVRRPGFLPEGKTMVKSDGAGTSLRAGAPDGCEVRVFAGHDVEEGRHLLDLVLSSMEPA